MLNVAVCYLVLQSVTVLQSIERKPSTSDDETNESPVRSMAPAMHLREALAQRRGKAVFRVVDATPTTETLMGARSWLRMNVRRCRSLQKAWPRRPAWKVGMQFMYGLSRT